MERDIDASQVRYPGDVKSKASLRKRRKTLVEDVANRLLESAEEKIPKAEDVRFTIGMYTRGLMRSILESCAMLGLDLRFEIEALRDDFVSSASFKAAVAKVFYECHLSNQEGLDLGEFYCAVLLLYHKLNKIPFSGQKKPPRRSDIVALFNKYMAKQNKSEEGKLKSRASSSSSGTSSTKEKERIYYTDILKSRLMNTQLYLFGVLLLWFYEIIFGLFNGNGGIIVLVKDPKKLLSAVLAMILVVVVQNLYLFLEHSIRKPTAEKKGRAVLDFQSNSLVLRESELHVEPRMTFTTFKRLCQKHFDKIVFTEAWRITVKSIILPLIAIVLKQGIDKIQFYLFPRATRAIFPYSLVMSLCLLLAPYIVDPVVNSVLFREINDGIHNEFQWIPETRSTVEKAPELLRKSSTHSRLYFQKERERKKREKKRLLKMKLNDLLSHGYREEGDMDDFEGFQYLPEKKPSVS